MPSSPNSARKMNAGNSDEELRQIIVKTTPGREPDIRHTSFVVKDEPRRIKVQLVQSEEADEDDGDLEDPQEKLKQNCRETEVCASMVQLLEECNDRVNSKELTKETCEQELYDLFHCVDKCVAKDLFKLLK